MRASGNPAASEPRGEADVYTQDFDPVSDSLGLTAIFAALPLITLFVLLGGLKMKAHWAALISLGVAMLVALIVYGMPAGQTGLSGAEGAAFGLFPIMWIVVMAIWVYNMTVETGHFAVLRRSFGAISDRPAHPGRDHRLLLRRPARGARRLRHARGDHRGDDDRGRLQADQGGGARPRGEHGAGRLRRDGDSDHHPVRGHRARQGRSRLDGRPPDAVPRADRPADPDRHGRRPPRHPPDVAGGRGRRALFAIGQFLCSNYISAELTDIVAALASTAAIVGFLRFWQPGEPLIAEAPAGRFSRPGRRRRLVHDPVMEREVARRDDTAEGLDGRHRPRLRAVRDHHRDLLAVADPGDQGRARRVAVDHHLRVARPRRAEPGRRAALQPHVQLQLAAGRRHADVDLAG